MSTSGKAGLRVFRACGLLTLFTMAVSVGIVALMAFRDTCDTPVTRRISFGLMLLTVSLALCTYVLPSLVQGSTREQCLWSLRLKLLVVDRQTHPFRFWLRVAIFGTVAILAAIFGVFALVGIIKPPIP